MLVNHLPLDLSDRLAKWKAWSNSIAHIDYEGADWMKAASAFFSRFATSRTAMHPHFGDWEAVNMADWTARVAPPHQVEDLAWKFFRRGEGRFGVTLVGTIA